MVGGLTVRIGGFDGSFIDVVGLIDFFSFVIVIQRSTAPTGTG
jgi:hypothetical protein